MTQTDKTHLTPRLICEQIGVGIETVLSWIHRGELRASNISNSPVRPRWLVAKKDLASFLDQRSNQQRSRQKLKRQSPKPKKNYI